MVWGVSGRRGSVKPVGSKMDFAMGGAVGLGGGRPGPFGGMKLPVGLLPSGLIRKAFTCGMSLMSMVGYVSQSTALTLSESNTTPSCKARLIDCIKLASIAVTTFR